VAPTGSTTHSGGQSPDDAPYGRPRPLTLKEQLDGALLDPEEAEAMEVQGGRTHSAVLVPLYVDDGVVHAVFTRRRHDLKRHAGEISFPGGRLEPGETLMEAALREAHEEIGLPPEDVDVVGALAPVGTFVTNYAIYPFVGVIEPGTAWVPQAREVAEVLELPLEEVRAAHAEKRLVRKGIPFRTDTYEVGDAMIWGATARIVADLLRRFEQT
jgi:8-oxo-dGTP pyrophosphatase MutT (NUDIX family)